MARTKVAFLYSEVAGYFLACARELAKEADVMVVRWPVNKEAPFTIDNSLNFQIVDKSAQSEEALTGQVLKFNPDILVCSGWMDKTYLGIARRFKKKIPVVLTLDNHWTGSLKQRIASFISPFYLKRIFTHAWVPGTPQQTFAEHLGFKGKILRNFYCADTNLFYKLYASTFPAKRSALPKRFLYVGRYVEHKGIFEMWNAFLALQKSKPNDWELWCLGTGDQWENRVEGAKIKHFGFVQPGEMQHYISQCSVYVLPSKFEPWGVSVQEFAICGFPLLISDAVGSGEQYLKSNGYRFRSGSVEEIKQAMEKIVSSDESVLRRMADESHALGVAFTPELWTKNLLGILTK